MKLYLIRHAESANNAINEGREGVAGRVPDPEVTETGHRQSALLAQHLATPGNEPRRSPFSDVNDIHYDFTHLYCSLMTRSILTAEYISRACNIKLQALSDIFERKGIYEFDEQGKEVGIAGPARGYFEDRFPGLELPEWVDHQGWWNRPAETDEQFFMRVGESLNNVILKHGHTDDRVAMVVHGDYIDQCINELLGVERKEENYDNAWMANWVLHNTSVSRIDIISGSRNIVYLNRIDHLPADLVTI